MSDLRRVLFALSARQGLDAMQARRLHQLASLDPPASEPAQLPFWLARGMAVLAMVLLGFGLMLWVAANWQDFGRFGRFALLQGLVLAPGLGAGATPWRAPLGLLALMATGALLAYFGQTYQTGADAWQLFALWAVLSLPLALSVRSDVVWAPWSMVAVLAIVLWTQTQTGHRWRVESSDLGVHLLAFGELMLLCIGLGPLLQRLTGAGAWSLRTAASLSVLSVLLAALGGLFAAGVRPQYGLGLAVLTVAALLLVTRLGFEIFVLSAVVLALDILLIAGVARWLFVDYHASGEPIGQMLLLGLLGAGLLAVSVSIIMRLARSEQEAA